jgi:hypothetical protein
MNNIIANLIRVLHIVLICFVIGVPFIKKLPWQFIMLHFVTVFSLLLHWCTNSDDCLLSLLESKIRGIPIETSFMYSLVSPVYKNEISDEQIRSMVTIITPFLGFATLFRFVNNWDKIEKSVKNNLSIVEI